MESLRASLALRTHFEVFGLEAHKSSKMSYPRLEDSPFFVSLKMSHGHELFLRYLGNRQKPRGKFGKNFFSGGRLKKNFGYFFWGGRTLAPCVLGLGFFFVSLASKVASSTPPLQNSKIRFGHLFYYLYLNSFYFFHKIDFEP